MWYDRLGIKPLPRENVLNSQDQYNQLRSCRCKKSYVTMEKAQRLVDIMNAEGHNKHAYKCPFCYLFHIGRI